MQTDYCVTINLSKATWLRHESRPVREQLWTAYQNGLINVHDVYAIMTGAMETLSKINPLGKLPDVIK